MQISVNEAACEGHALCQLAAPDVFALDDDGLVQLVHEQLPEALEARAEAGARARPVAALSIVR